MSYLIALEAKLFFHNTLAYRQTHRQTDDKQHIVTAAGLCNAIATFG